MYVDAYESYVDDGLAANDLHRKAMSTYSNWAAKEWKKPSDLTPNEIPFLRSTTNQKVANRTPMRPYRTKKGSIEPISMR